MTVTRDAIWTIRNPVGRMRDLPLRRQSAAAHPMLASMGQGASSATEDGYALAELLARVPDPVAVLRTYEELGRKRTRVKGLRRLAKLEQTENRLALAARNLGLRLAPTCVLTRQTVRPMWFDMAWSAL